MPVRPLTPGGPRSSSPPGRAAPSLGAQSRVGTLVKRRCAEQRTRRGVCGEARSREGRGSGGGKEAEQPPPLLLSARPPPPSLAPPSLAPAFCAPEPGRQRAPTAAALTGAPGHRLRERRCREGGSSSRGCSRNQGAARHRRARTHTTHTHRHTQSADRLGLGGRLCSSSLPCTMLRSRQRRPAAP